MLPSSVTRVKKSKATGDTLTFTAASVHTSFNNNTELKLGHVVKVFLVAFLFATVQTGYFQNLCCSASSMIVVLTLQNEIIILNCIYLIHDIPNFTNPL